jgi:hypothetical protein
VRAISTSPWRTWPRSAAGVLGATFLALGLAGCGVPVESGAQPLPSGVLPPATPSPTITPTQTSQPTPAPATARLWFVQEEGIVPVTAPLEGTDPQQLLNALAEGPPPEYPNLRTVVVDPLTGDAFVSAVDTRPARPGIVTVQASPAFTALPPTEQVLLLGQVVLTLTGVRTTEGVLVVNEQGEALAVPLPDGRLLDGPATAADYRSLVRPR